MVQKILEMERNPLFTQNLDLLEAEENRWYSCYNNERGPRGPACESSVNDRMRKGEVPPIYLHFQSPWRPRVYAVSSHPETSEARIAVSQPTWTTDDEVRVMANVQAYFQVAHKVSSESED